MKIFDFRQEVVKFRKKQKRNLKNHFPIKQYFAADDDSYLSLGIIDKTRERMDLCGKIVKTNEVSVKQRFFEEIITFI